MHAMNMKKIYVLLTLGALATIAVVFIATNGQGEVLFAAGLQEGSYQRSGARLLSESKITGEGDEQSLPLGTSSDDASSGRTDVTLPQNSSRVFLESDTSLRDQRQNAPPFNSLKSEVLSILRHGGDVGRSSNHSKQKPSRTSSKTPPTGDLMTVTTASCGTPKKNVLFLKTHKTGSSTVQNILYRYGDINGLTFALPVVDVYMGSPSLFREKFAIKSPTGKYNVLANHARYYRPTMQNIMHDDAAYITIIRHPSTQFESMYDFYGFKETFRVDLATFVKEPIKYYPRQGAHPMHSAVNPTLYDLGMSKETLSNEEAIRKKIATLENEFDLVLVSEYILESLVLLKDLLCWDFNDVTFFSANARIHPKYNQMSERTFEQISKWNHGDALLYGHFNRTLWAKIDVYGRERMAMDVRTLEKMNEALAEKCVGGTTIAKNVKSVVNRYVLKKSAEGDEQCVRMIRPAVQYLGVLRKKQAEKWKYH